MILSKKLEEDKFKQIGTEGRPCTLQKIMYTTVMLINVDGGVGFVFSFRIYLFVRCYEFNLHVKLWYKKDEYYLVEKLAMGSCANVDENCFRSESSICTRRHPITSLWVSVAKKCNLLH